MMQYTHTHANTAAMYVKHKDIMPNIQLSFISHRIKPDIATY